MDLELWWHGFGALVTSGMDLELCGMDLQLWSPVPWIWSPGHQWHGLGALRHGFGALRHGFTALVTSGMDLELSDGSKINQNRGSEREDTDPLSQLCWGCMVNLFVE